MAAAAYERAGFDLGVAETQHNLGITYRDQGNWGQAIQAADRAVEQATRLGELGLKAQALAGRAEIRLVSGDAAVARREVEQALKVHRELGEEVREAEDLRILACVLAEFDQEDEAELLLHDVIERAIAHSRPLLAATAGRDLAFLLERAGRSGDARDVAQAAVERFERLGAVAQVRKLVEAFAVMTVSDTAA